METQFLKTNFPDAADLARVEQEISAKLDATQPADERLLRNASGALNWVADIVFDEGARWECRTLALDDLYLTGTIPAQNAYIIERCQRSPKLLRELFRTEPASKHAFTPNEHDTAFKENPVLILFHDGKHKVLHGMPRVLAALMEERREITAWVATIEGTPRPPCEPHVVYDLIRAYQRGLHTDRAGLVAALRLLRTSYYNVVPLLRERFDKRWVPQEELQAIIDETLPEEKGK